MAQSKRSYHQVPFAPNVLIVNDIARRARRVTSYAYFARRLLFKWLNRRSQSRSLTWEQFAAVIACRLPRGRILHNLYPMPMGKTQTGSRMV
jgi:RNA-directed DNA polymerase